MTSGVVMFALNGQALDKENNKVYVDYVKMALANAINIKKYMVNNSVSTPAAIALIGNSSVSVARLFSNNCLACIK